MKLLLQRGPSSLESTVGDLYIDGKHECVTLEDVVRPVGDKIFGQTAIPPGTYSIGITHSPHFGRDLPLVLNVPNYEGVRIHKGNSAKDTEGCILVGETKGTDWINNSGHAFDVLFAKLQLAVAAGQAITLTILSA